MKMKEHLIGFGRMPGQLEWSLGRTLFPEELEKALVSTMLSFAPELARIKASK